MLSAQCSARAPCASARAATKLRGGALNEKALVLLIQHAIPSTDRPTSKQIKAVLDAAESLKDQYLKR